MNTLFPLFAGWEPAALQTVHIDDSDDGATIRVDMPGLGPEDVDLTLQEGVLAIRGNRGERSYSYQVTLGNAYDPDRIEADLDKGVLTVRASKRPEARPRRIALKMRDERKELASGA